MNNHQGGRRPGDTGMHSEGGNADADKHTRKLSAITDHRQTWRGSLSRHRPAVSPLGPQRLSPQLDLEPQLRMRPRHHGLGLRGLSKAVVLPLVLLVLFMLPFVDAVQA